MGLRLQRDRRRGFGGRGVRAGIRLVCLAALLGACEPAEPERRSDTANSSSGGVWFEDVVSSAGVDFVHTSGAAGDYRFPEISTGGVALLDFDGDGLLDLYFAQGGALPGTAAATGERERSGNRLYRNLGGLAFADVTARAGVGDTGYGMGAACGDYDGDGDVDLYVTNVGANVLYRNEGDGTFRDVTATAGVGDAAWGASAAFLDYDSDGDLDLFVVNYIHWSPVNELECASPLGGRDYCLPKNYQAPARDTLYENIGDARFADATGAAGLDRAFGNGFGVACADYNADGRVDLYVANDGTPNQLWLNQGNGRFRDQALLAGCALNRHGWAEAGMGVAAVDLEPDGDPDLFLSHLEEETNTFYENNAGVFTDRSVEVGLAVPSKGFTGFGLGFADFDHDGSLDLYVANGGVKRAPKRWETDDLYAEPNQLFRRGAGGRFEEVTPRGGTAALLVAVSRGAAFGDLDVDGDIDIVVANRDGRPHLLRNVAGPRGRWVRFRVLDRRGREALGARVAVTIAGRRQWRAVERAYSFCASNDPCVHFGLGAAAGVEATAVHWPDGREEEFGPRPAGELHVLRQGRASREGEPRSR